jgi:ubiquinone/menaquinone biosynthesis C-methylase UbiE
MSEGVPAPDIYDPAFVKGVFDRCSGRYAAFIAICSLGLAGRWRRQCVEALPAAGDPLTCYDLMAGTGEAWPHLLRRFPKTGRIVAVDISPRMRERAMKRLHARRDRRIHYIEDEVLRTAIPPGTVDALISTFGIKAFNHDQQYAFSLLIAYVLKPGGSFSLIEMSDPKGWWLRPLFLFHLRIVMPLVERLLLAHAGDFATVRAYGRRFSDPSGLARMLREAGLEVESRKYFFGCATGISGRKPA